MRYFSDVYFDRNGNVKNGLSITVKVNGSTATLYSSKSGASQDNPVEIDSNGILSFWYDTPGVYTFLDSNGNTVDTRNLDSRTSALEFGCACDGVTNDTTAFQAALNRGGVVEVPANSIILLSPGVTLPDGVSIMGEAVATATGTGSDSFKAPRIRFTGTGAAGFISADETTYLNQGAVCGLTIDTASGSQIDYIFDLRGPISWAFKDLRIENTWSNGGGFRSRAIVGDLTTWLNRMFNVEIRVDDASTKYAFDTDWSDSCAVGCIFTGGIGSIYRGPGHMEYLGCEFDRSNASGLTLSKELSSVGTVNVVGCAIDANVVGITITAASNPSGTYYCPQIIGCGFRNPSATYDIVFDSTGISSVMSGPVISGCSFGQSGVTPWSVDETKWLMTIGINSYSDTTWVSSIFGDTRKQTAVIGREGINLPGAVFARTSKTFRSMPNVAGAFGVDTDASPMLVVGAKDGTNAFIGASRNGSGTATNLGFATDTAIRLWLTANGTQLYPATDLAMALGASTQRFTNLFTNMATLVDGITAPSTLAGHAQIYVDTADGDLKVKFGDGTVKTIVVDT